MVMNGEHNTEEVLLKTNVHAQERDFSALFHTVHWWMAKHLLETLIQSNVLTWAYILHLRTFIDIGKKCPFVFRTWLTAWCDVTWASGKLEKKRALLHLKTFSVFWYVVFLPGFVCVVKWVLVYPDSDIFTDKFEITFTNANEQYAFSSLCKPLQSAYLTRGTCFLF